MSKYAWDFTKPEQLIEAAWGIIANAHHGNWDEATQEWREAAEHWRDGYHAYLDQAKETLTNGDGSKKQEAPDVKE